jgi:8-oxo-dGTP pyrophosphatase MutT (NUDIX family)
MEPGGFPMPRRIFSHPGILRQLELYLRGREPKRCPFFGLVEAAVAVPLVFDEGVLKLVLIKRSQSLRIHPGQIAFPGGRRSPGDKDLLATAMRELHEELGIPGERTEVLGCMDQEFTFTNYSVMPFVLELKTPLAFKTNEEVERPILLEVESLDSRSFLPEEHTYMGRSVNSWRIETSHGTIWGATARILYRLLTVLEELSEPSR